MSEADPLNKTISLLTLNWNKVSIPLPTIFLWNESPTQRVELGLGDILVVSYDASGHTVEYMDSWDYKRTRDFVKVEIRTIVDRQRMLDLMAEIRRIVILLKHDSVSTGYQVWKFRSFIESPASTRKNWAGECSLSFESDGVPNA